MTHRERLQRTVKGQPADFPPSIFIATSVVCQLLDIRQDQWATDPALLADSLIHFTEMSGCDGIYVTRDNLVTHQAMGGRVIFPPDDEPMGPEPVLASVSDFQRLSLPDPESAAGMSTVLTAARRAVKRSGDQTYVMANIDCGPFSTAANLRGVENFLMDIMSEEPSLLHDYLSFCTELVIAYGKQMQHTGVHGIQFGDASASLVGQNQFDTLVLPYLQKACQALHHPQCDLWVHICGKTDHILPSLSDASFDVFEVDALVPLKTARELLGEQTVLKGNLDTVFLQEANPADVYQATRQMIDSLDSREGLIVSAGCGVPRWTPLENIQAMVRACQDSPIYS